MDESMRAFLNIVVLVSMLGSGWMSRGTDARFFVREGFQSGVDRSYSNAAAVGITENVNEPDVPDFDPSRLEMNLVASGINQPLAITHAGDGSGRIFIVERAGRILVLSAGSLSSTPFLDIRSIVNSSASERGLLALTFHPQYETNGHFYTVHTNASGSLVLSRFTVSPANSSQASPSSRIELLVIPHPTYTNHNGSTLAFGQDGYLYWSTGDGGGGGDPFNNAQNLNSLLGKILRLDVNSALPYAIPPTNPFYDDPSSSIRKEIWAYGLRNPWRISFDRLTQDLYIGDVGQGSREEINVQPSNSPGGENYGWDIMEGSICYNAATCNQNNKVLPVTEYTHSVGCSVTGGYVYRGSSYPSLVGHYLYADFCEGKFFHLYRSDVSGWISSQLIDTAYGVSTFGEDEDGELYFADYFQGTVYQITYTDTRFVDVPVDHPYRNEIEILYVNGLTAGCSVNPLKFCPDHFLQRAEMAVFMLRGNLGVGYTPPAVASHLFADNWAPGPWAEKWAEGMYLEGLTAGCFTSPLKFCPWGLTPREQAAVFGLRLKYGNNYTPPLATGTLFADMTDVNYYGTKWAEQAYRDDLIPACGTSGGKPMFCPQELVTRGLGAYIIVRAKDLSMP